MLPQARFTNEHELGNNTQPTLNLTDSGKKANIRYANTLAEAISTFRNECLLIDNLPPVITIWMNRLQH